ncbi:1,4-alpha-glucan branching protein GlgB [Telmatospirillum siberiense]|uniref:1,4-alpha-glucan branching enzyme GlgB n=1 Tax=Telmatospirillum siberiense TaxID=382514 RepID=A0A2N3PQI1_9PROT|nr:1,4-alpha-glucan branching protein GlgB [Telmatospirillum siberiense]PKU22648.1 1,4-alpha-glucan branching enzyme [Telmatospirillum siberiense]
MAIDAIIRADHGDPFAFLGLQEGEDGLVLRCMQPGAAAVAVIDPASGEVIADLPRLHPDGLFGGPVGRRQRFDYRLRIEDGNGKSLVRDDPYRFPPILGELDLHLLGEGTHLHLYQRLGAHVMRLDDVPGVSFAVWAPNARRVSVIGDFNGWDGRVHPMRRRGGSGVWEIFIPDLAAGALYKYELTDAKGRLLPAKADPYGFYAEQPPRTASKVFDLGSYGWTDSSWMARRQEASARQAPVSIYEVHLGSWRRKPGEDNRSLTYRELADELGVYVKEMGFTHIELLPIHEHPFTGSWGYQPIGLYAPTSRFGSPDDFRAFVDHMHDLGIGVIIDWVAGHFPTDAHGLRLFDGTHLYEHADPRQGMHKDWNTAIFNFGRNEVANYLYSNALFWLEEYHIDGLRVDAVASMLYLDYSRQPGEWIPNRYGGNENLEAIEFLRRMNEVVYGEQKGAVTIAEESTAWPMVSRPVHLGGLGFGYKWNMGWMHDTLHYMSRDPIHRRYHHDDLTFGLLYAFHENFVLPLSHDEVVHGKGSIFGRMPGDTWQKFANLRAYYAFMFAHPGKKLLFMGQEFGQESEWNIDASLDWHLLAEPAHQGIRRCVADLNRLYRDLPALHQQDCEAQGFAWIDCNDRDNSVISWRRMAVDPDDFVVVVINFTPVVREFYRLGVPRGGWYQEMLNTDSGYYGGSDVGLAGGRVADDIPWHGHPYSLALRLPPLAALILRPERR